MHAKDKQKCLNFIVALKAEPDIIPFLVNFENNPVYYYDFDLIVSNKKLDISSIEKNLKSNKYKIVKDFYRDVKAHFENFVVYCFDGDEVSIAAKKFIRFVNDH